MGIFEREALLIGEEGVEKLAKKTVAVFGLGGVGSFVGMHLMHHKTRHTNFRIGVPICALLQLAALAALIVLT